MATIAEIEEALEYIETAKTELNDIGYITASNDTMISEIIHLLDLVKENLYAPLGRAYLDLKQKDR